MTQLLIQSPAASPIKFKGGRLQLGLTGLLNGNGFSQIHNWWKTGEAYTIFRSAEGAATVAPGSPGVFTKAGHNLQAIAPIKFKNLPSGTGLANGTVYYVVAAGLTTNTFSVSATKGGAALAVSGAGGALDIDSALGGQAAIDAGYLTADLELVDPLPPDADRMQKQIFVSTGNIGENYDNEQFNLSFTGTARKVEMFLGGANPTQPGNTSPTTFKFGTTPTQAWLWFWLTPGQSNPPRDINAYQSRYAADVAAGKKLNKDYINVIKEFEPLRCMNLLCTNDSNIKEFEDFATESYSIWNSNAPAKGPKFGIPWSIIAALATETGRALWVNIPHQASDTCVQKIAQFCKNNIPQKVFFELSNELWNGLFSQASYCSGHPEANTFWPGHGNRGLRWAGYRAAQCMKIIRDEYNDPTRWAGKLGTQTANTGVLTEMLLGADYFLTNTLVPANSLVPADLFVDASGTGYFSCGPMTEAFVGSITQEENALVSTGSTGHSFQPGDEVAFGFNSLTGSMRGLEAYNSASPTRVYATILAVPATPVGSNGSPTTFRINLDTRTFSPYTGNGFVVRSNLFRLMDLSEAANAADPVKYPTIYSFIAAEMASAMITGSCSSGLMSASGGIPGQAEGVWTTNKNNAAARGLGWDQYEGGCHFVGGTALKSNGPLSTSTSQNRLCSRYFGILRNTSHSPEFAKAYSEMFRMMYKSGGHHPAKFVDAGAITMHGSWPGMRWFPFGNNATADVDNPIWKATRAANMAHFAL